MCFRRNSHSLQSVPLHNNNNTKLSASPNVFDMNLTNTAEFEENMKKRAVKVF